MHILGMERPTSFFKGLALLSALVLGLGEAGNALAQESGTPVAPFLGVWSFDARACALQQRLIAEGSSLFEGRFVHRNGYRGKEYRCGFDELRRLDRRRLSVRAHCRAAGEGYVERATWRLTGEDAMTVAPESGRIRTFVRCQPALAAAERRFVADLRGIWVALEESCPGDAGAVLNDAAQNYVRVTESGVIGHGQACLFSEIELTDDDRARVALSCWRMDGGDDARLTQHWRVAADDRMTVTGGDAGRIRRSQLRRCD